MRDINRCVVFLVLVVAFALVDVSTSFSIFHEPSRNRLDITQHVSGIKTAASSFSYRPFSMLHSTPDPFQQEDDTSDVVTPPKELEQSTDSDYPINLPSPILLATSMVLAIASTGSIFELSGGNPQLGAGVSAAIAALGVPASFFLFYAAIRKGAAETEEDDRRFLNK